jgi:signal transduction histidine kinase
LALAQAGVVLAFVVALLAYVYFATVGQLLAEADIVADQEYANLERVYSEGGIRQLSLEVAQRTRPDGSLIYGLTDAAGVVVAGDFENQLPDPSPAGSHLTFDLERTEAGGEQVTARARGRMGRLLGGPTLVVAVDLRDRGAIASRITNALWSVALIGLALSVASGLIASWLASRRAEDLANTAREVMAGDMSRRAPVRGDGDEFDALAEALNAMLDRLERLMHAMRTAGDAIAHDLRSPVTRFRQRIEAALETPPNSASDRDALRKAAEEADHLLDMFGGILKLARVEASGNWSLQRIDATSVLSDLAEFYEPAAEEARLGFRSDIEPGLVLSGEAALFAQAVSNLIENALKYTPAGGRLEFSARLRPDGRIEVMVRDDGPGIPAHDRDRVLERFVRLEAARTSPGAGLGLSLVAAVARLHQGGLHLRDGLPNVSGFGLGAALVLPALQEERVP